jgi:hypothetical protein
MIDFPLALIRRVTNYDLSTLTITGFFSEADIDLAKAGFIAEVSASSGFKDMNANR